MRLADQMLLAQIRQHLLGHLADDQWKLVEEEVEKAGGIREVDGYAGTLIRDAIEKKSKVETVMSEFKSGKLKSSSGKKVKSRKQAIAIALSEQRRAKKEEVSKASFGGDRSAAGRYAAQQRWKGHTKGEATPETKARITVQALTAANAKTDIKSSDLSGLARMIERDLKAQGKQVPVAAKPYLDAMRTMGSINEDYGFDTGRSVVAYLLGNLRGYKGETARAVKAELNRRLKGGEEEIQSDKGLAPATEDDKLVARRPDLLPEEAFRNKDQFKTFRDTATYKQVVQNKKAEIARGKDGIARHRGTNLAGARESLEAEKEMLRSFESGERTARRILGSPFKKTEARAILQARVAQATATVQALEEFEDETSPGFLSS